MATQVSTNGGATPVLSFKAHAQVFDTDAGIMVDCDMLINYHAKRGGPIEWKISGDDSTLSHINGRIC